MIAPKAILVDMDDTLFDEHDYVKSGFQAVASFLERERSVPADYSYPSMVAFWELEGRGLVFDRIIERFEIRSSDGLVQACIDTYRHHMPDIKPYDGARDTLLKLRDIAPLALVTNGLPVMQKNKLNALELMSCFDEVVFCDALHAPKPSPKGLLKALSDMSVAPEDAVMIGDNPETDGAAAAAAETAFIRVYTQRFAHVTSNGYMVPHFNDVPAFLNNDLGAELNVG